jgi:hypothetical protein
MGQPCGGAEIVDKYGKEEAQRNNPSEGDALQGADESSTGQRRAAVYENGLSLN